MKQKTLEEYKDSKYRRDRLIWFISIQSPHNLWKAEGELDDWLREEISLAFEATKVEEKELPTTNEELVEKIKECIKDMFSGKNPNASNDLFNKIGFNEALSAKAQKEKEYLNQLNN